MAYLWCDRLIFAFLCGLIFVLPATTAGVEIFALLAIVVLMFKKALAFAAACRTSRGFVLSVIALPRPVAPVSIPVGAFILVCLVSIFWSAAPSLSVNAFIGKTLKTALLFFAVQECMTTQRRITWFLRVALVSAFILCLDAMWQLYAGQDIFKNHVLTDGRVNASFKHANSLGAYLIIIIPLAVVSVFSWAEKCRDQVGKRLVRLFIAGAITAFFIAVMGLTLSRGAWLGLACATVVFFSFDKRTWLAGIVTAVFFFLVFNPLLMNSRQVTLITDSVHSSGIENMGGNGRISFWSDAMRMIRERPVFGAGLNTYTKVIREFVPGNQNYAHNSYLQLTAELGITGLAVILWVFFAVFAMARRKILAQPLSEARWALIALLAGWVGLLVQSGVDNVFYSVQLSVLLWLIMGTIVVLSARN